MTLRHTESEVGVRELHDHHGGRPLETLMRRRLVRMPEGERSPRSARAEAADSVSDLVTEQRA